MMIGADGRPPVVLRGQCSRITRSGSNGTIALVFSKFGIVVVAHFLAAFDLDLVEMLNIVTLPTKFSQSRKPRFILQPVQLRLFSS